MIRELPRTLLLSWQRPDGRYAGAEVLRKIVRTLPRESVRWAYLGLPMKGETPPGLPESRAFPPRSLSWRFRNHVLNWLYMYNVQAPRIAAGIAAWAEPFRPQVVWVLAEMGAVNMARHLSRRLRIPVHATVHDSYAFARFARPHAYYSTYRRNVARLMKTVRSMDAVTESLLEDVRVSFPMPRLRAAVAMPPSVATDQIAAATGGARKDRTRRIGICGSLRIGERQWTAFLGWLGQLPYDFRLVVFADRDAFFSVPTPANAAVEHCEYVSSEADVIRRFRAERVDACYLGLSLRPDQRMFAAHSLSSKLAAYAAAAAPVIVHGPAESAAWRLVEKYGAGILCDSEGAEPPGALSALFAGGEAPARMAAGAEQLCRMEFDLEKNVKRLADAIAATALESIS